MEAARRGHPDLAKHRGYTFSLGDEFKPLPLAESDMHAKRSEGIQGEAPKGALARLEELVTQYRALKTGTQAPRDTASTEEQHIAIRSGKISSAVKAGLKRSASDPRGKAKTESRKTALVAGSKQHTLGVGAHHFSGRSALSLVPPKKTYTFYQNGAIHSTAVYVPPGAAMPDMSVPVARGAAYRGAMSAIRESVDKSGRKADVVGHQFLGTVSWNSTLPPSIGARPEQGIYVISPDSLGGSLQLLAKNYEQHRARKLRIKYIPSVASTEAGAIAMFFRNDVATPVDQVGLTNLTHAATHPSFLQTQVWEAADLVIDPNDATMSYFDDDNGDSRMQVQGIVEVLAASSLANPKSYGNLYLEYDIEFFSQELSFEIADIATGTMNAGANAQAVTVFNPFIAVFNSVAPGPVGTFKIGIASGTTPDSTNYVFACTMTNIGTAFGYTTRANGGEVQNASFYQGFFMRVYNTVIGSANYTNDSLSAVFFNDYASAIAWDGPNSEVTDGQWLWGATGNANNGFSCSFRALPLTTE